MVEPQQNNNSVEPKKTDMSRYSESVRTELIKLMNIRRLLRRIPDMKGDEAFAYVDVCSYVEEKIALIKTAEEARIAPKAKEEAA